MVNEQDVLEMARIRNIILGGSALTESDATAKINAPQYIGEEVDAKADMRNIIARFNQGINTEIAERHIEEAVSMVYESSRNDKVLHEAIHTERTPNGVKMGSWEIEVIEGQNTKSYDVVNTHTGQPIAIELSIYEAALALTKMLNTNIGINSPRIKQVLDLEERYSRLRQDAAMFRVRMRQRMDADDVSRAAISEDRYNEAKTEALALRETLKSICRRL